MSPGIQKLLLELATSTSLWAAVGGALVVCLAALFGKNGRAVIWRWMDRPVLTGLLLAYASLGAALALDMSYAAPRDIMQDIVSADEMWHGRSLYPIPMTEQIREMLDAQPVRWSLGSLVPAIRRQEIRAYELAMSQHWVQAHPPLMTILVAIPERLLGARPVIVLMNAVSLAAIPIIVFLLCSGLGIAATVTQRLTLATLVLGGYPATYLFRVGQSGLLLSLLIVAGWYWLRRGHPAAAGLAIGLATALKLYPGLLLLYLLLRSRKAFVSAVITVGAAFAAIGFAAGWSVFPDYLRTVDFVSARYLDYDSNYSILGSLATLAKDGHFPVGWVKPAFAGIAAALLAAAGAVYRRTSLTQYRADDLLYGTLVTLMPLLSPISWQHYWPVLLLPLFLIGAHVALADNWETVAAYCVLLALLSIPEGVFNEWFFRGMPALAVLAVWAWLLSMLATQRSLDTEAAAAS